MAHLGKRPVYRRALLQYCSVAAVLAALRPITGFKWGEARAGQASKADFHYQEQPKDGHRCADCAAFVVSGTGSSQMGTCKILAGPISPDGWCMAFSKK
jgi:hypothetical protein